MIDLNRDPNFTCEGCHGNIVLVGIDESGREIYDCDKCEKNRMVACTICKKPKSIWADDGKICGGCAMRVLTSHEGEFTFTKEQQAAVDKWKVTI